MATVRPEDFTTPNPGVWRFDPVHFPRPMSRIAAEVLSPAVAAGTVIGAQRYGALTGALLLEPILRFRYTRVAPLVPRPAGNEEQARAAFDRIVQEHPEVQARVAAAQRALDTRLWVEDVRRWDSDEKPRAVAGTLALAAVDIVALDTPTLASHVAEALDHLATTLARHHSFNSTWTIPLGIFLTRGAEWTGLNGGELLALLEGASPISSGQTPELEALAAALRSDPAASQLLESADAPASIIAGLRALPGATGEAARGFLDLHGFACVGGFDTVETYALERPETVIASIRAATGREATPPADIARVEEATAAVRLLVPMEHREAFDTVLADARQCYRIKDERGLYNDVPARGLVRRAIMEVGRRLRASGRLVEAEHALEAGPAELQDLLAGSGPSAEELQARYAYRLDNSDATPPATVGTADGSDVPAAWLPEAVRRVQRATGAALQAMGGGAAPEPLAAAPRTLRGVAASRGVYEGPTRIVTSPTDFARIEQGDVLVTLATTPAISAWLPLLGAIVTNFGGPLSHAAIVAREFGLPAVVGTGSATRTFHDGQRLRVDGAAGTVEPLD